MALLTPGLPLSRRTLWPGIAAVAIRLGEGEWVIFRSGPSSGFRAL